MGTNHTPGPWVAYAQGDANEFCILDANSRKWVAALRLNGEMMPATQERAAALIAAAPELLAALNECRTLLLYGGMTFDERGAAIKNADAAIAKATTGAAA